MGSILWRNGGKRLVVQWIDAAGRTRQETLRLALDDRGAPLAKRTQERLARARIAELELEVRRQLAGVSPLNTEILDRPLSYLIGWWWEQRGRALKSPSIRPFIEKHLGPELLATPLRLVTPVRLEKLLLTDLEPVLKPKSRKTLRGYLFTAFAAARKRGGPWEGRPNPVDDVPVPAVPKAVRSILRPEEMAPVLDRVPENRRGPCAVALFAGLREGEIFGLRKADVDLEAGLMLVTRSWDADRTKDGKPRPLVVAPPLRPYLEAAMKSPGPLCFPRANGSMEPRHLRLGKMLRRAIVAAGLVIGYQHRCRAWRCGWRELRPEAEAPETCPKCGRPTTWSKAIPRHVRFHDTRHSHVTQVLRAAGLAVAQKAAGHSDIRLTSDLYGHLDVEDLRQGIMRSFPEAPKPPEEPRRLRAIPGGAEEPEGE